MKNLPIRPFHNFCYSQITILLIRFATEEYKPGLPFGAHMELRIVYRFFQELDTLEDLGIFGRKILEQTLKKWNVRMEMCVTWDSNSWQTLVNRLINFWGLLGKLIEFLLFKKDSAVLSYSPTAVKQDWQPFGRRLCICLVMCNSHLFFRKVTKLDDFLIIAYFKASQAYLGLIYSGLINQP